MADNDAKGPEELTSDNLSERIERIAQRDTATAVQPGAKANAAPSAVAPAMGGAADANTATATPEIDWADTGLQVDHGWLRGKKPDEIVKAFKSAQSKIQELGTRARQLESRTPAPAYQPAAPQAPQRTSETPSDVDPRIAEYEVASFTNPLRAREIMLEWNREERAREREAERINGEQRKHQDVAVNAASSALKKLKDAYGLTEAELQERIIDHVAIEIRKEADRVMAEAIGDSDDPALIERATDMWRDVWKSEANYIATFERIYGKPNGGSVAPVVAAPSLTPRADPPGSTTVAPVRATRETAAVVTGENERALNNLANLVGLSKEGASRFTARAAKR